MREMFSEWKRFELDKNKNTGQIHKRIGTISFQMHQPKNGMVIGFESYQFDGFLGRPGHSSNETY